MSAWFEISPDRVAMHHQDGTETVYAEGMADRSPPGPCQCDSCAVIRRLRAEMDAARAASEQIAGWRVAEEAELDRLRGKLEQISRLHYLADDDAAGAPYCPECQAYDGTGSPCATRKILDGSRGPEAT